MVFTRAIAIAFASSAALALVLASSLAVADGTDSDGDGVSDELEDATQRTVAVSTAGDGFNVSSHLGTAPQEDQFDLSYHAGTFDVSYSLSSGISSSYSLEVLNLIAWKDGNANGRIDLGEIVRTIGLGSTAFGDVRVLLSNRTDRDGGRVFQFLIPSRDTNVTLNVTVAQRFQRIGNIVLTPMEAQLDIGVNPAVVPPGANLGLVFRMDTNERVTLLDHSWDEVNHFAPDEREINVTASGQGHSSTVFFSWANTAMADGSPIPVTLMNGPVQPGPYNLTLSYPFGSPAPSSQVLQHTTLGVRSAVYEIRRTAPVLSGPQGDFVLYAATFAGAAAFVVVTIVLANRRSRKP
jgi:hypothetical protein